VSVDEEMSNLIEQQQQFAASARVLRTAQEVTSTLLSM
jgi:flagellar hook-associated protein 1 FlgK